MRKRFSVCTLSCFLAIQKTYIILSSANIEMLLHLLLVHVSYYSSSSSSATALDRRRPFSLAQSQSHGSLTLSQSQSHLKSSTLRLLTVPDAGSFRAEASSVVDRVLEKLESINLVSFNHCNKPANN